jgi:hypothetical protein
VVRLIRSKGVGVYFVTQSPLDIPDSVLGQLSNRVQHALRAFTPKDQKAVKTAADTFRPNPKFKAADAIVELGVGEALVSFLDAKGVPTPVERCFIKPPQGRIGPVTDAERAAIVKASPLAGKYEQSIDRESAYEVLNKRSTAGQVKHDDAPPPSPVPTAPPAPKVPRPAPSAPARRGDTALEATMKSMGRTAGNVLVREGAKVLRKEGPVILRSILGSLMKGR